MKNKKNVPDIRFKGFADEWERQQLGDKDITTSYSGGTPSVGVKEYYNGSIPFIRSGEINNNQTELFITDNGLNNSSAKMVEVGDILYALYGATSGEVGMSQINGAVNQAIMAIKPKAGYSSYFIAYWLRKEKDNIIRTYLQGGQGNLSSAIVKGLEVSFPKSNEQETIGNYFKNIDRLINTSQAKLDKLKNIKQACLEKMFPRNGSTTPELRFKGFAEEWKEEQMAEIGNPFNGLSGKTKDDFGHGDAKFITYMNVFSNPVADLYRTESVEIDNKQNSVKYEDILFTVSSETPDQVGMSSVWLGHEDNIYLNSFCFGYRLTTHKDPYYMAYLLRSKSTRKKIAFLAQGISRYNISKNRVMEIVLPFPEAEEQKVAGSFFKNIDDIIAKTEQQIDKLKNIKKACLDKMFVNTEDKI